METSEHQEWRARQQFSPVAAMKGGFAVGLILFFMSGGSPWSTAGTANMVMGRDLPWGLVPLAFCHFAVAFLYAYVIGMVIFRLHVVLAVPAGILTGLALYALNELIFRSAGLTMMTTPFVPFFVHVVFSLFYSLVYKALSVPPPLPEHALE